MQGGATARRGRGKWRFAAVAAGLVLAAGGALAAAPGAAADGALGKTLPGAPAASSPQVYRYEKVMPTFKCHADASSYLLHYLQQGYRAQAYCTFAGVGGVPPFVVPYAKLTLIVIG